MIYKEDMEKHTRELENKLYIGEYIPDTTVRRVDCRTYYIGIIRFVNYIEEREIRILTTYCKENRLDWSLESSGDFEDIGITQGMYWIGITIWPNKEVLMEK